MKKRHDNHAVPQMDDGAAFFPDPRSGPIHLTDDLAQQLAQEFVSSATSAEDSTEDSRNELATEEIGGPFLEASSAQEFGLDHDEADDGREGNEEPFPTAMRSERR